MKATINGETTLYVGAHLEYRVDDSTLVKYYDAGSQRIAMREGSNTPYFFVGDHLGSTSLTLNQNGTVYSEMRYKPFGETAWSSLTETPTQRRYTGQIQDFEMGNVQLYFYNARYYDPELARFTQADTIVPEPGNPQTFNRFSYVNNNPIRYADPTGHEPDNEDPNQGVASCTTSWCWQNRWYNANGYFWDGEGWSIEGIAFFRDMDVLLEVLSNASMTPVGNWTFTELSYVGEEVVALTQKITSIVGSDSYKHPHTMIDGKVRLRELLGNKPITLSRESVYIEMAGNLCMPKPSVYASVVANGSGYTISVYDFYFEHADNRGSKQGYRGYIVHELGHIINNENLRFWIETPGGAFGWAPGAGVTAWGGTSKDENFAEALALWVYPNYFNYGGEQPLSPRQQGFMKSLIEGWHWE